MNLVHKQMAMIVLAGFVLFGLARTADAADAAPQKISANQCVDVRASSTAGSGAASWEMKNLCAESVRVVMCLTSAPKGTTQQDLIGHATCSITVLDPHQTRSGTTPLTMRPGDWLYTTHGSCFLSIGNERCYQLAVDMKNQYEGRK
ncbi:MAG TPA: hypothetical protein VNH42_01690 [Mariprofundaceae bacterium]|nr:hypothetical protein [Mariprofundaceae bacterium]